jgi:O-antigen/teichoic acid export membrane protein
MILLLAFVLNAGINFILGLLVAFFLGPAEFGRYAIGASLMVLVTASCIDWLKYAAQRFYSERARAEAPEIRATLDVLAAGISLALAGLVVAAAVAGVDVGLPAMLLGASVAAAICGGLFEYHSAIARARFMDGVYARLILVKNVLALVLMAGGAWWFRDATMVMIGSCLAIGAALLVVRRALADGRLDWRAASAASAREFAVYALPLVMANVLYVAMPLVNRAWLAKAHGFAEAGYFSLASDIGLKLFGTTGAALELLLFQHVVRIDENEGREAAEARMSRNMGIVLAVLLPMLAGLWLVLPAFEALIVPPDFRGHFSAYMLLLAPGFFFMALLQAAFYPALMIARKTGPATFAAALALIANLVLLLLLDPARQPQAFALAQSAGFALALVFTALVVGSATSARPRLRDILVVLGATFAMLGLMWPLRGRFIPIIELPLIAGLGGLAYLAILFAADMGGLRGAVADWRARRRKTGP